MRHLSAEMTRQRHAFDQINQRLSDAGNRQITVLQDRLDSLERVRKTVGYKETLKRGFAVVRDGERVVTTKAGAKAAKALEIEFGDGRFALGTASAAKPTRKAAKPKPVDPDQGSLL